MATTKEISAGVVSFYTGDKGREYLLLQYGSGYWGFSKGNIEQGETPVEAARRELREETGIDEIKLIRDFEETINYFYTRSNQRIYKKVIYFAGKTLHKKTKLSHEHEDFIWLLYEQALKRLTFQNSIDVLRKLEEHLPRSGAED